MTDQPRNRRQERRERMERAAHPHKSVRVEPTNEEYRKTLKHGRTGFPSSGSAEWPYDTFTKRRIADGSVKLAADQQGLDKPKAQRRAASPFAHTPHTAHQPK